MGIQETATTMNCKSFLVMALLYVISVQAKKANAGSNTDHHDAYYRPDTPGNCSRGFLWNESQQRCYWQWKIITGPNTDNHDPYRPDTPGNCRRGFLWNKSQQRCYWQWKIITEEGGNEPCDPFKCELTNFAVFQREKGCVPIKKEGECCASEWDCSTWEERLKHKDKCFVVNEAHPRGKLYKVWEEIPVLFPEKQAVCFCEKDPKSERYAMTSCDHYDVAYPPKYGDVPCLVRNGCREIGDDCICGKELEKKYREEGCEHEGDKYIWGDKIKSKEHECLTRTCQKGWNGTLAEPFCSISTCGYTYYSEVEKIKNCEPIAQKRVCCSWRDDDWKC